MLVEGEYSSGYVDDEPVDSIEQVISSDGTAGQDLPVMALYGLQIQNL